MPFNWCSMNGARGVVAIVDGYDTLEEALGEMASSAWEDTDPGLVDYVKADDGSVVAVAILERPSLELLVTCSDGRQLRFPVPTVYRG